MNAKRKKKKSELTPYVHSPMSERSQAVLRAAHYACRCHELKPYDNCDVTTTLESDDVSVVRVTESESYSDDDDATGEIVGALSPHKEKEKEKK
ncbi:hypothetical protein RB195_003887 [Necator americanus]